MIRATTTLVAALSVAAVMPVGGAPVLAADYFSGKTIRLIHAGSGRGSYAIYTRIVARHFGRHLGGEPSVVADFMEGGGGLKGQNYLYNAALKTGLVIGMPLPSVVTSAMIYPDVTRFVASKFEWLGNISQMQTAVGVWTTAPATTIEDAMKTEVIIGASGRTSELSLTPRLMNAVLGTKFKIVEGYKGMGGLNLAMEKHEVHGRSGGMTAWHPLKPHWFQPENKIAFLAQLGMSPHPAIPDVPLVMSLAKSEDDRQVLELMSRSTVLTRPIAAPPGVSKAVVAELHAAFDAMMKDSAFLSEMEARKMQIIDPMTRDEVIKFVRETEATPKSVVDRFRELLDIRS